MSSGVGPGLETILGLWAVVQPTPDLQRQDWKCPGLCALFIGRSGGWFPQVAAPGDEEEDEDDGDFVEVPEKEGYEACIPDHLQPEYGECSGSGRGVLLRMLTLRA